MFYVYRLKYSSEAAFNSAMITRGVLVDSQDHGIINGENTLAVVRLGLNPQDQAATYNAAGEELTAATFFSGYHADIKVTEALAFTSSNHVTPSNPMHGIKWAEGAINL